MPTYFVIRTFKTELQRLRTAIDHLAVSPYGAETPNSTDSAIAEASLALDSLERRLHFAQEELSQNQERARAASELSWNLRRRLADEAAKVRELDNRLQEIESSVVWKITKPLWKLLRRRHPIQHRNAEFSYTVQWPRSWKTSRTEL